MVYRTVYYMLQRIQIGILLVINQEKQHAKHSTSQ